MNQTKTLFSLMLRRAALAVLATVTAAATWAQTKTAYAVLTDNGDEAGTKTLTFKYEEHTLGDNEWNVSDTGTSYPGWYDYSNSITTVVFEATFADARPTSCCRWFEYFAKLSTIEGLRNLNTSEVTNMANMFRGCNSLQSLDLSSLNTSKVTNMSYMFCGCSGLASLDLSNFNTSNVGKGDGIPGSMNYMFYGCSSLKNLDLNTFNTSQVKSMRSMFYGCSGLASLTIGSGFTIGSETETTTTDMFSGCTALAEGMLIVNGTTAPSIAQNIFGVFTNGVLATNLTKMELGIKETSSPYTWKGGKFKSVGKVKIPYIDENGKLHYDDGTDTPTDTSDDCAEALPITSANSDVEYAGGWYFVAGNVTINGQLKFTSDASIILCDGAKMTVTNTEDDAIYGDASIAIYGQSNSTGTLIANSISGGGIHSFPLLKIVGGTVNAKGSNGINAYTAILISGGNVTAEGISGNGIYCANNVTITGGTVNANGSTCGISANTGTITLGWTNAGDCIKASSYNYGFSMKTAADKRFVAYNMASDNDISANCIIGSIALDVLTNTTEDAIDGNAIAGKTLRPLNGYIVSTSDGNISMTDADGTTTKTPDFTITGTSTNAATISYYIYQSGDPVNITLSNSATVPEGYTIGDINMKDAESNVVSATETETAGVFSFNMTATDVNILGVKYCMTNVSYIGWDETNKTYITDAKTPDGTKVWVLDGTEASLGTVNTETWYVSNTAPSTANENEGLYYDQVLILYGDVHLILADGAKMTVSSNGRAIYGDGNITIYSQNTSAETMGSLTANGTCGIYSIGDVRIYGGKVTANGYGNMSPSGISASNVYIHGGQVTATAAGESSKGIAASNVYIYGGQVTATATGDDSTGILCNGSTGISIQWTNENDYIMASSYYLVGSESSFKANKPFVVYNGETAVSTISGTVSDYMALRDKTLRPAIVATVTTTAGTQLFSVDATNTTDAAALQAAVNYAQSLYVAAEGDTPATIATVTLNKDVSFGSSDNDLLTIGDGSTATAVKLDLNGKTLSSTMENICVVSVKAYAELTIIGNGTISNTRKLSYAINNNGTLNVSGGNISGTQIAISNSGMLTVSGGTISTTGEEGFGIENFGTLTLHALDVFGNNGADIWLYTGKKIGFGSGTYSIPEKKIKVASYEDNALPYTFTSGYSTYVKSGNDIIDPAEVFDNSAKIILFGGEAQLMDANAIYVKYIDANGKLHDDLDGSTETTDDDGAAALPITNANDNVEYSGGWYYASGNVTINGTLEFTGDAHIILCDGVKMTVTTNTDADAISATNLNIYGQSNSTGTLTVNSDITAKSISAPGVTVIAKDKDATKDITANGNVMAGSVIASELTAKNHNLTLTGTGSEIGITNLSTGTLTVNANAGGSVGKLTAAKVIVNNGGKLTATSVTDLSTLTVTGGTLSLSEASNLSSVTSVTLASDGVIKTDGSVLTVGSVSGIGTIQGKDGVVLMSTIDNPNLNIVSETKNITATDNNVTYIKAKSLTATDGGIIATGKDITAETILARGTVTARNIKAVSGGNGSSGYMILGWNAPDNFIQASSYEGTVKIADGQYFTYEGNTGGLLSGTLSAEQVTAIAGQKLTPVVVHKVTVPAGQYITYFNTDALTLGTEQTDAALYTISSVTDTQAVLSDPIETAPADTPLLVWNGSEQDKDIMLFSSQEPDLQLTVYEGFNGTAIDKTFSEDDMSGKKYYVLLAGNMFVRVSGAGTIAANRCWLELPNSNQNAARSLVIIGDGAESTGIVEITDPTPNPAPAGAGSWYSLDGRRLSGKPTTKGVYINNGRKVVIK